MTKENRNSEIIYTFKCPSCEEGIINIIRSIYDLPDGDKMLILKFECNTCDFNKNDIIPLTTTISTTTTALLPYASSTTEMSPSKTARVSISSSGTTRSITFGIIPRTIDTSTEKPTTAACRSSRQ